MKKNNRVIDRVTHVISPSPYPEEPPEYTLCGKPLTSLLRCCVYSVEASSCLKCINIDQAGRRGYSRYK